MPTALYIRSFNLIPVINNWKPNRITSNDEKSIKSSRCARVSTLRHYRINRTSLIIISIWIYPRCYCEIPCIEIQTRIIRTVHIVVRSIESQLSAICKHHIAPTIPLSAIHTLPSRSGIFGRVHVHEHAIVVLDTAIDDRVSAALVHVQFEHEPAIYTEWFAYGVLGAVGVVHCAVVALVAVIGDSIGVIDAGFVKRNVEHETCAVRVCSEIQFFSFWRIQGSVVDACLSDVAVKKTIYRRITTYIKISHFGCRA